jgi:hypothetical protein
MVYALCACMPGREGDGRTGRKPAPPLLVSLRCRQAEGQGTRSRYATPSRPVARQTDAAVDAARTAVRRSIRSPAGLAPMS